VAFRRSAAPRGWEPLVAVGTSSPLASRLLHFPWSVARRSTAAGERVERRRPRRGRPFRAAGPERVAVAARVLYKILKQILETSDKKRVYKNQFFIMWISRSAYLL